MTLVFTPDSWESARKASDFGTSEVVIVAPEVRYSPRYNQIRVDFLEYHNVSHELSMDLVNIGEKTFVALVFGA